MRRRPVSLKGRLVRDKFPVQGMTARRGFIDFPDEAGSWRGRVHSVAMRWALSRTGNDDCTAGLRSSRAIARSKRGVRGFS